jgi:hypothetical protein
MTDPRYTDPRLSDPVLRRDEPVGGTWGWIAGIAVVALIAFLVIAGLNGNSNTASNGSAPATTGSTTGMSPPSTTGSGATSQRPLIPEPATPSKGDAQ